MPQSQSPTKEEIQARIKFFKDNTLRKLSKKETLDDMANQLYFRELIVKAYAKKFNKLPTLRSSEAKVFAYDISNSFFSVLSGKSKVKLVSALIAADILGIEFKPPQKITNLGLMVYDNVLTGIKKIDEKYIEIILEHINERAEENLKNRVCNITDENIENQKYFRELVIKAFLQKYNSLPLGIFKKRDDEAKFFGCDSIQSLSNEITMREESLLKPLSALIAAEILKIKFNPPHEISYIEKDKNALKRYEDHGFKEEYIDFVLNYFNRLASQHHETNGAPRFPDTEKYFRELIIRALIKKFDLIPRADSAPKYAKPFGYSHFGGFFACLINQTNKEIPLEAASVAAKMLGVKLEIPDKKYAPKIRTLFLGKNNEFLDSVIRTYQLIAVANYEILGKPSDYKNQDYYRDLVLRAFVKLHNSAPSSTSTVEEVLPFNLDDPKKFYDKIVFANSPIDAEIALKAAGILDLEFKPPQPITKPIKIRYENVLTGNKKVDEKYIQIIVEHFHYRAKKILKKRICYISPENIENQKYFRELVVKAFLQKYNYLPIIIDARSYPETKDFGSKNLCKEIIMKDGSCIKPLSALIAARILKTKFNPPHEISDINTDKEVLKLYSDHGFREEYIEYILNYFNRLASQHHETYGTPRFPETEKYFRELIIKAFIKKFNLIPRTDIDDKYAKPFGYDRMSSLFYTLVNQAGEISLKLAATAAEIFGVEVKIPDKDYSPKIRAIFLGKNNEFIDYVIRTYQLIALTNYETSGEPDDYKNQDYYRDLVLRAFAKLHNSVPTSTSSSKQISHFTITKPQSFYRKIVFADGRIEADMALKAADILGVKFKPPQYKYFEDEISEIRSGLRISEEFLM